jgi:2-deoxy-D-gluconate 3-dehydrogenase
VTEANFSLRGKVVVVTGGNGGLGRAMARAVRAAGATVVVTGRNPDRNADAAREFDVRTLDVRDPDAVEALFADVRADLGRLDVLVNNAGVYLDNPLSGDVWPAWDEQVAVNLTGTLAGARAAARCMVPQNSGKIINVGSVYSTVGHPNSVGYAATKAGVLGLTRSLAAELGPHGIQVNAILPGWFPTAMNSDLPDQPRGTEIRRRTPAGRWGTDADLAGVVVFLAAPASDFVTGVAIPVDGGYTISDRYLYA